MCAYSVDHPSTTYLMNMEHIVSLYCGFGIYVYLGCATSCSRMMGLVPQGIR
jgi:hypothetical protein